MNKICLWLEKTIWCYFKIKLMLIKFCIRIYIRQVLMFPHALKAIIKIFIIGMKYLLIVGFNIKVILWKQLSSIGSMLIFYMSSVKLLKDQKTKIEVSEQMHKN